MSYNFPVQVTLETPGEHGWGPWEKMHVVALEGDEGLSQLFELELTLFYADSRPLSNPGQVLGRAATLKMRPAGDEAAAPRVVSGVIASIQYCEAVRDTEDRPLHVYRVTLVPRVWCLLQTRDCRTFRGTSVLKILTSVLGKHNLRTGQDVVFRLGKEELESRAHELAWPGGPRDEDGFRIQYRESDWDFACRLMEEHGLFYWFDHGARGAHPLVVGNHNRHLKVDAPETELRYRRAGEVGEPMVYRFHLRHTLCPDAVTLRDYNPGRATVTLECTARAADQPSRATYDYPGGFRTTGKTMEAVTRLRLEQERMPARGAVAESTCLGVVPGHRLLLGGLPDAELCGRYVPTWVSHRFALADPLRSYREGVGTYDNAFRAVPYEVPYRPPRATHKPTIDGLQTAVVMGLTGATPKRSIFSDASGRVRVRFHWDRDGAASCWLRVSQVLASAGMGKGSMFLPHPGDEVLVAFEEGDPDRPVVVGSVYPTALSGEVYTPYGLGGGGTVGQGKK